MIERSFGMRDTVGRKPTIVRGLGLWALGLLLAVNAGCGRRREGDFEPPEAKARSALEKALTAWKSGQAEQEITGDSGKIRPMDWEWRAGEHLSDFQILRSEETDGQKWFAVRLVTASAPEGKEVRYRIRGINPVWVFREED